MRHSRRSTRARLARMLNEGVLQDAVAVGLEEQGQFEIDTLDLLDALQSAGLQLALRDDADEPPA